MFSSFLKYIVIIILFSSHMCGSTSTTSKIITLKKNNFISIDDKISDSNVAKWTSQLSKLNTNPVYLYIDSPGGSVDAGLQFINVMNWHINQGKTINCIAKSAYSMGFVIFQNCSNRYVMTSTTLMQHQMSLTGIKGPLNNLMNYLEMVNQMSYQLDNMVSLRLNMTLDNYRNRISNDWWIYGSLALSYNVADELVIVGCDNELYETNIQEEELVLDINEKGELELVPNNKIKNLCPL